MIFTFSFFIFIWGLLSFIQLPFFITVLIIVIIQKCFWAKLIKILVAIHHIFIFVILKHLTMRILERVNNLLWILRNWEYLLLLLAWLLNEVLRLIYLLLLLLKWELLRSLLLLKWLRHRILRWLTKKLRLLWSLLLWLRINLLNGLDLYGLLLWIMLRLLLRVEHLIQV